MDEKRSFARENLRTTDPKKHRTVRVTVPVKVAFDLGRMQEVTESVLDRLGCPQCHSGWDIRFDMERNFVVDENLNIDSLREGPLR